MTTTPKPELPADAKPEIRSSADVIRKHKEYIWPSVANFYQTPLVADRGSMPVLEECSARGIAFVPFFPLGSGFARDNPVLGNTQVLSVAGRLGLTPAQVVLAWLLDLAPCVLLIPGTSSVAHLEENLAAAGATLDEDARRRLAEA